jgi:hypothetical protein
MLPYFDVLIYLVYSCFSRLGSAREVLEKRYKLYQQRGWI